MFSTVPEGLNVDCQVIKFLLIICLSLVFAYLLMSACCIDTDSVIVVATVVVDVTDLDARLFF